MNRNPLVWFSLVVAWLIAPLGLAADYANLGQGAKDSFTPVGEEQIADARSELGQSVIAVERLVGAETAAGAAWLDYLVWDGVQKQITPGASVDLPAARKTLRRLASGADGLERPAMQRMASALEDYLGLAAFSRVDVERQEKVYKQAVDTLIEGLSDEEKVASARGSFAIERSLALVTGLEPLGVGRPLLATARSDYGRPNLRIEAQSSLLNRLATRPVTNCAAIEDCILGTRIRGTGATSAVVRLSTLPSLGSARLAFHLSGSVRSHTTGVNGPVSIRSVGDTSFNATKVVTLSDSSFSVAPASASATTRTQTQSVKKIGGGLGSRIIESIARKQVAKKKPRADAIAGSRAEGRIKRQLDRELDGQIANARRRYEEGFTKPLKQRLATPRFLTQSTTSGSLVIEAVQADGDQLAASGSSPVSVSGPVSAQVHQSAINNLLDDFLAGATIRRDAEDKPPTMDVIAPSWLKLEAEPTEEGQEFRPWSLRLRNPRPISVELDEEKVTVLMHAAQITADGKSYKGWDLIATYQPARVDGKWRLIREGEVDVLPTRFDPASGKQLRSGDVGLRNNLVKALNERGEAFPAEIDIHRIDLSSRKGPVRELVMQGFRVTDGWLAAAWRAL